MRSTEVKLINRSGLHARPAVRFVQLASKFKSTVEICKQGRCVNGKNILQVLSLGVDFGDVILLKIDGEDEDLAYNELLSLLVEVLPKEDR